MISPRGFPAGNAWKISRIEHFRSFSSFLISGSGPIFLKIDYFSGSPWGKSSKSVSKRRSRAPWGKSEREKGQEAAGKPWPSKTYQERSFNKAFLLE